MDLFVVGEDDACKAMIYRVIAFCFNDRKASYNVISELPARGGEIKSKIKSFNSLSLSTPVILLTDLDNNICPPSFINTLMGGTDRNNDFLLSIAVDEVEAWLLADREGFSQYFSIGIEHIPIASKIRMQGRVEKKEIVCPCKTSLHFATRILPHCQSQTLKKQLTPRFGATKGPEYNIVMTAYIKDYWDIKKAMQASDSLKGMINRVLRLIDINSPDIPTL